VKRAPALIAVAALGVTIAVPAGAATPPAFAGFMSAGTYEIEVEVGCSPDVNGGTCTGNWSFKLEIGDLIGP
jgi:hypothetical protein